jgi:hypothetical protein
LVATCDAAEQAAEDSGAAGDAGSGEDERAAGVSKDDAGIEGERTSGVSAGEGNAAVARVDS